MKLTRLAFLMMTMSAVLSSAVSAQNQTLDSAPLASPEAAKIRHWRQPDIGVEFWDIPKLNGYFVDVKPQLKNDNIPVAQLNVTDDGKKRLLQLAKELHEGKHGNYDSLLILQNGKQVFESYYLRGRIDLPHPQSSVTKAYTGMALGRAMQLGYLQMQDLQKPVTHFLKELDPSKFVAGAKDITLYQALTMTTGIRITDETRKLLTENPKLVTGQQEIQMLLEKSSPITKESKAFYYDIGPQFVMQVLEVVVPGSVKDFIKHELLGKMGISNFDWKTAPSGLPESIWRASLTSRDMIKMGMLARSKGKWNGEQLIHKDFITQSTSKLITTGDDEIYGDGEDVSNQGYGYYWWNSELSYNGKQYFSVSAQGGGGMYIMLIEELDLVIAITAHHVEHATQQIIADYVIPAFVP